MLKYVKIIILLTEIKNPKEVSLSPFNITNGEEMSASSQ